jgi:hypothetical protein
LDLLLSRLVAPIDPFVASTQIKGISFCFTEMMAELIAFISLVDSIG